MIRSLALLLLVVSSLQPSSARACSCMASSLEEAVAQASAVFEGRVESIVTEGDGLTVTLAVTQAWGGVERERVVVHTRLDSAACGFPFEQGERYLVFAGGEPDALDVSLCSHTARLEDAAADRAALGAGVIPVDIEDEPAAPVEDEPPARGGCASCAASPRSRAPIGLLVIGALALLTRRREQDRT